MAKSSFLLVSLKENKAKKLAEVISNNTCRKILDYLASQTDATESQISKELALPISTVHYNMKALLTARLIKCDEYHYSEKGKEVNHYRLANQFVIIAPEGEKNIIREKLKSIIPAALIVGAASVIIKIFQGGSVITKQSMALASRSSGVIEKTAYELPTLASDEAMAGSAPATQNFAEAVPKIAERAIEATTNIPDIALWFFVGAAAGIVVYLIVEYVVKRVRNR